MSRIISAIALSGLLVVPAVAQTPPPPQTNRPQTPVTSQTKPQPPEVTLHGCIVQATTPGMFLLRAAVDPTKKGDTAKIYRLTSQVEDPDFTSVTNKQVSATGIPDAKPQPKPNEKVKDEDLPTFSVSKFEAIADTCAGLR
jgi:hypothetical protein